MILKIKKRHIILSLILIIISIGSIVTFMKIRSFVTSKPKVSINTESDIKVSEKQKELLYSLVGLESSNMKILEKPLRIIGTYKVPEETVFNYIEYYLKYTKNKDIQDVEVSIDEKSLKINAKYKLLNAFKTSIEISILPSITQSNQLKLNIKDIKVLGISIEDELIDAIVDSWFGQIEGIVVNKGEVIIDKENFKDIILKDINLEEDKLIVDLEISLE